MLPTRLAARFVVLVWCATAVACAGALTPPRAQSKPDNADALLILPGFGYGRSGEHVLQSLAPAIAAEGLDLFVPTYIARGGLVKSRANLQRFMQEQHLDRYERLHVFAFLAGAWTFNPAAEGSAIPNLTTVVYDRSPFQERAPRIADEALHFWAWVRFGSVVFDVARTPYVPLTSPGVKVGIAVETVPTSFVRDHEAVAKSYGPLTFDCDQFRQHYDDCMYLPFNHDQIYVQFAAVLPELLAFIKHSRFTPEANRTAPAGDPWIRK